MAEEPTKVPQEEIDLSYTIQSPFVTRTLITVRGPNVRLTFLEQREPGSTNHPRASVTMDVAAFLSFKELVNRIAENVDAMIERVPLDGEAQE